MGGYRSALALGIREVIDKVCLRLGCVDSQLIHGRTFQLSCDCIYGCDATLSGELLPSGEIPSLLTDSMRSWSYEREVGVDLCPGCVEQVDGHSHARQNRHSR